MGPGGVKSMNKEQLPDLVKVIRCKDCKYCMSKTILDVTTCICSLWKTEDNGHRVSQEGYCYHGRPKNG